MLLLVSFHIIFAGTMLNTKQLIPSLTLHVSDGRTVRAWDFKQKKNLVIAFLDVDCAPCADFLRRLAVRAGDLRAKESVALAAFLQTPVQALTDALPTEIVVGSDVSGRGARAFLGDDALSSRGLARRGVFVTDRYGELATQWIVPGDEFPAVGEIIACLSYLEDLC
jgi:peroxiredoxin